MKNKIIKEIIKADKIALFGHQRPDGDSMSSSYGLGLALREKFPEKEIVWVVDMEYIKMSYPDKEIDMSMVRSEIDDSFITIVGDVSGKERIDGFDEWNKGKVKICFDHHQNDQDCEPDLFWHEPTYSASTLQAIEIVKGLDIKLTETVALELLVGILTDTGFFKFSLSNPIPPRYYSEMLEYISDETMSNFFNRFNRRSKDDIEITSHILSNIQYEGRVAYVVFDNAIVKKYGEHKIKIKVNTIANIEDYPIWAFFTETKAYEDNPWEISLRSNGPQVNLIAAKYNGGGHVRAAGAKTTTREMVNQVIKDLNEE